MLSSLFLCISSNKNIYKINFSLIFYVRGNFEDTPSLSC